MVFVAAAAEDMDEGGRLSLKGSRLVIDSFRPKEDDFHVLLEILKDPLTKQFFTRDVSVPHSVHVVTYYSHSIFLAYVEQMNDNALNAPLVIRSGKKIVGLAILRKSVHANRFVIGYAIHPEFRGRRIATRTIAVLTKWIRKNYVAAFIEAHVLPDNGPSRSALKHNGYWDMGLDGDFCRYALMFDP